MPRILVPPSKEVLVISFGGAGSTFLLSFLSNYFRTNELSNFDSIKHSTLPPLSRNPNLKAVYIYSDPRLATVSLFNRGYARNHSRYLQNPLHPAGRVPAGTTLENYVEEGIDRFDFEGHFNNWHERFQPNYPVLFMQYETLYDHLPVLFDFLELPEEARRAFPQEQKRRSSLESLPETTRDALEKLYGSFAEQLRQRPPIEVRQPTTPRFSCGTLLKKPYVGELWKEPLEFPALYLRKLRRKLRMLKRSAKAAS